MKWHDWIWRVALYTVGYFLIIVGAVVLVEALLGNIR